MIKIWLYTQQKVRFSQILDKHEVQGLWFFNENDKQTVYNNLIIEMTAKEFLKKIIPENLNNINDFKDRLIKVLNVLQLFLLE